MIAEGAITTGVITGGRDRCSIEPLLRKCPQSRASRGVAGILRIRDITSSTVRSKDRIGEKVTVGMMRLGIKVCGR